MAKRSVFRKGSAGLGESKEAGEKEFIGLKDGDAVNLASLVSMDELISVDQHAIWLDGGNSPMFPCIGEGCPGEALGNQPRFRAFLPVVVLPENEVKIFGFGIRVARALEELDNEFSGIKGHVFKVKRKGSGLSTNYTIVAMGKTVDTSGMVAPDITSKLGPTTKEGILELLKETGAMEGGKEDEKPKKEETGEDWDHV